MQSNNNNQLKLFISILLIFTLIQYSLTPVTVLADSDNDNDSDEDYSIVTCGSAIKLISVGTNTRLHSHKINWGTGSGQQSVTSTFSSDDPGSLWQIRDPIGNSYSGPCLSGTPIKCGTIVRLQHVNTKKYLHSHLHQSPLSGRQEVSAYGADDNSGSVSDTGDNWRFECINSNNNNNYFVRDRALPGGIINIVHVDTNRRLYTNKQFQFDQNNCRNCPIVGQLEVSADKASSTDTATQWYADNNDGIYFPVKK